MRRPKKLYRPTGAASSSADRLGPGMETVALKFVPNEGSTCSDSGAKSVDALSTEKPATAGVSGVPHATVAKLASTPWFITWEVGVGASVDRGLRLAKVQRFAADDKARRKLLSEQYVAGESRMSLAQELRVLFHRVCLPVMTTRLLCGVIRSPATSERRMSRRCTAEVWSRARRHWSLTSFRRQCSCHFRCCPRQGNFRQETWKFTTRPTSYVLRTSEIIVLGIHSTIGCIGETLGYVVDAVKHPTERLPLVLLW